MSHNSTAPPGADGIVQGSADWRAADYTAKWWLFYLDVLRLPFLISILVKRLIPKTDSAIGPG